MGGLGKNPKWEGVEPKRKNYQFQFRNLGSLGGVSIFQKFPNYDKAQTQSYNEDLI